MTINNTKNKFLDLHNHLFCQLERLSDEKVKKDKLNEEIQRARAVVGVANQIINNGRLVLDAQKAYSDGYIRDSGEKYMMGLLEHKKDL